MTLDPDNMFAHDELSKFCALLEEYDEVFDPVFQGYNGAEGPFEAVVNMSPVQPPQRKGHLPQYAHDKLCELPLPVSVHTHSLNLYKPNLAPTYFFVFIFLFILPH